MATAYRTAQTIYIGAAKTLDALQKLQEAVRQEYAAGEIEGAVDVRNPSSMEMIRVLQGAKFSPLVVEFESNEARDAYVTKLDLDVCSTLGGFNNAQEEMALLSSENLDIHVTDGRTVAEIYGLDMAKKDDDYNTRVRVVGPSTQSAIPEEATLESFDEGLSKNLATVELDENGNVRKVSMSLGTGEGPAREHAKFLYDLQDRYTGKADEDFAAKVAAESENQPVSDDEYAAFMAEMGLDAEISTVEIPDIISTDLTIPQGAYAFTAFRVDAIGPTIAQMIQFAKDAGAGDQIAASGKHPNFTWIALRKRLMAYDVQTRVSEAGFEKVIVRPVTNEGRVIGEAENSLLDTGIVINEEAIRPWNSRKAEWDEADQDIRDQYIENINTNEFSFTVLEGFNNQGKAGVYVMITPTEFSTKKENENIIYTGELHLPSVLTAKMEPVPNKVNMWRWTGPTKTSGTVTARDSVSRVLGGMGMTFNPFLREPD